MQHGSPTAPQVLLCTLKDTVHNNETVHAPNHFALIMKEKKVAMGGGGGCVCSHSRERDSVIQRDCETVKCYIGCHIKELYDLKGNTKPQPASQISRKWPFLPDTPYRVGGGGDLWYWTA